MRSGAFRALSWSWQKRRWRERPRQRCRWTKAPLPFTEFSLLYFCWLSHIFLYTRCPLMDFAHVFAERLHVSTSPTRTPKRPLHMIKLTILHRWVGKFIGLQVSSSGNRSSIILIKLSITSRHKNSMISHNLAITILTDLQLFYTHSFS